MGEPRKASLKRRDATGHLDPTYQRDLLQKARAGREVEQRAFVEGPMAPDDLAEELGEAFIESATTGEGSESERREQSTPEETGGPFVTTSAAEEFASGTDESNIAEATREPFPKTSRADG
ncbi:MAG: hypothetical protein QM756_14515 [Polyangiaceae bacterium]